MGDPFPDRRDYARDYGDAVVRHAAKHGTPGWNPPPHPDADADAIARRDADPLWEYHRALRGYSGDDIYTPVQARVLGSLDRPSPYQVIHPVQVQHHTSEPNPTIPLPVGLGHWADAVGRTGPDQELTARRGTDDPANGHLSPNNEFNRAYYRTLFDFHGRGRRPWYNAVFPLQDLVHFAVPHDPYRLLAASVMTGNRHALLPLVDLLKRRDNPGGWAPVWSALARRMDDQIHDLDADDVLRRAGAVGRATASLMPDPDEHLAHVRGAESDPVGFASLADRMQEAGHDSYAQLLRAELANLFPALRATPRRRGSRL